MACKSHKVLPPHHVSTTLYLLDMKKFSWQNIAVIIMITLGYMSCKLAGEPILAAEVVWGDQL